MERREVEKEGGCERGRKGEGAGCKGKKGEIEGGREREKNNI